MTRLHHLPPNRFFVVDAFTSSEDPTLKGNPAGVLITARPLEDLEAETIAKKLALPAIALLSDPDLFSGETLSEDAELGISWIGPDGYWMPLCGHATMAASLALFELFPRTRAFTFVGTRSGRRIPVSRTKRGAEFAVPAMSRPVPVELMTRQAVLQLLNHAAGLQERDIAELREVVIGDVTNLMVELVPSINLQHLPVKPNNLLDMAYFGLWLINEDKDKDSEASFNTRVFWPKIGIPEDHVCGSAHTCFGPYWLAERSGDAAKNIDPVVGRKIVSKQVSPKGGRIGIRWNGIWGQEEGLCWLEGEGEVVDKGSLRDLETLA